MSSLVSPLELSPSFCLYGVTNKVVNNPEVVVEGGPMEQGWTAHRVLSTLA